MGTELERGTPDPEQRLRDDVREMGALLGDVLKAHEGVELYDLVERVRLLAKGARGGNAEDAATLHALLGALELERTLPLARAFSHFLGLANIAEMVHRVRAAEPTSGSCEAALRALLADGITPDALHAQVRALDIELVLTAHPTQAVRRTLLRKYGRIADALGARDGETRGVLEREITALWMTDELRRKKPTPVEEARGGLVLIEQILWKALPRFVRELDGALRATTGQGLALDAAPVRFGSWMGGDRDGNPAVTATVTEEVCLLARWMAARLHHDELYQLHDELSMNEATEEVQLLAGSAYEPYRQILKELLVELTAIRNDVNEALERVRAGEPWSLAPERCDLRRFTEPLLACHRSLHAIGAGAIADGQLLDSIRRFSAFGLTLVRLDIRQDARLHARALDAVTRALGLGSYLEWDEDQRSAFLLAELDSPRPLLPRVLPEDDALANVLATLAACRRQGPGSLGAYVISMASRPSDVLAVELLQREAGPAPPLRVVPLFETAADLVGASQVLETLLATPAHRARIGDHQEVMVGYSDSAKDAGRIASAWAIYRAQEELVATAQRHGVTLTIFHGRGGAISRGGGPIYLAIRSQPPGSVGGRLRVTIQGEMIDATFGLPGLAVQGLELYTTATLDATLRPQAPVPAEQRALMDRLAARSEASYRSVVHHEARFVEYFRQCTPVEELGYLNIGSRPARRGGAASGVDGLRAIPWVFAWTQIRLILPAWLGVGEGLRDCLAASPGTLAKMATGWPMFRALLDLLEMVFAKTDVRVAAFYEATLVPPELHDIGARLRQACGDASAAVLEAGGRTRLLDGEPLLRRSIALRNPYVDPLNLLQAELLRRLRRDEDPRLIDALLVTVNGIAAGMRNTG